MRALALAVLAAAACGGQPVAKVTPSVATARDAAPPTAPLPSGDAGALAAVISKPPSPFYLVARGYYPSSFEKLASGELLVTHGTKIWSPKPDGSLAVCTQLEGAMLTPVAGLVGAFGRVVGEWPAPLWTSAIYGGPEPDAHPLRI